MTDDPSIRARAANDAAARALAIHGPRHRRSHQLLRAAAHAAEVAFVAGHLVHEVHPPPRRRWPQSGAASIPATARGSS